jgi:hypothetical protein
MQLAALLAAAVACPSCTCQRAFLQRADPIPAFGQGNVDPIATENAALKPGDAALASAEDVEMASTDPGMVALALSDQPAFETKVKSALALVLDVPATRISVTIASKLSLLQYVSVRSHAAEAVMWIATFAPLPPVNSTANGAANGTTTTPCPPCPCAPVAAAALPFELPGDVAAMLPPPPAKPPAAALAAELVLMVKNPNSAINGLLPQTTARLPGAKFPRPDPTSVALGSRVTGMTPVEEAMKLNEETRKMVVAMKTQLQEANEARAWILSHGKPAPMNNGKLPLPSEDTDPWSSMKDESMLGKAAGAP